MTDHSRTVAGPKEGGSGEIDALRFDPDRDSVTDVVRRWIDRQPDAPVFLEDGAGVLTYGALGEVMDRFRERFWSLGLGREDRVAVVMPNGADLAATLFAVMGVSVPLPLNPGLAEDEFSRIFGENAIKALVVEDGLSTEALSAAATNGLLVIPVKRCSGGPGGAVDIRLSEDAAAVGGEADRRPQGPHDIHMLVATSGTTGRPVVTLRPNRPRVLDAVVSAKFLRLKPEDRYFSARPLYYGGGIGELTKAVLSGGSVVFLLAFEPADFCRVLRELRPTWYGSGPTVQRALHAYLKENPGAAEGACLRFIIADSAALEPAVAEELEELISAPVVEGYSCNGRIASNPLPPARRKRGTVGVPIDCEVRIRSLDGAILPPGQRGEIIVKGGRAFGPGDPNAEFDATDFAGDWFRTGDEGFLDEDGYLSVTGRIKEMINRGGEKVSPSEVDAALVSHPGVREAATFPVRHPTLGEEVAAAVVRDDDGGPDERALTKFLLARLAGFKVPRLYVFVEAIPKSDAGKVQRFKLAEALGVDATAGGSGPHQFERKPTPFEYRLFAIWRRVLQVNSFGLDDNFFLLGGDSLKAVELFLQIEQELKQRLPVAVLFEAGTIAEMARLIEEGTPRGCVVPIQPEGTRPPFFCVHGASGQVIGFHHLSRYLGPDQPFHGIQSIGWDATTPPFTRTEDMAARYIAEMREVQPRGPYYLGGYSFGGRIAVYMANMLKQAGEEVALLALIDPSYLGGRLHVGFGQWLERIDAPRGAPRLRLAVRYAWFRLRRAVSGINARARRAVLFPIREYYRKTGRTVPMSMRRPDRLNRLIRIEHRNMPSYDGDAVHFPTALGRRSMAHPDIKEGWRRAIKGRLEVIPLPGTHSGIIREPQVRELAKALAPVLDKAMAAHSKGDGGEGA